MEDRNNSLSASSEQTRKQINALRDEKIKVEEELHKVTETLSITNRNLSKLTLKHEEVNEQYEEAKVISYYYYYYYYSYYFSKLLTIAI